MERGSYFIVGTTEIKHFTNYSILNLIFEKYKSKNQLYNTIFLYLNIRFTIANGENFRKYASYLLVNRLFINYI